MNDSTVDLNKFPTTRYQGSKRKILPWIYENLKPLNFETALDGFGGSASVSYLLKKMNKSVYYNDRLKFNYLIGKALIENSENTLTNSDIEYLLSCNDTHTHKIVQENFSGIYYLDEENIEIDNIIYNIINMSDYDENILPYKQALSYYALFQSSLIKRPFNLFHRRNLNLRTADVKRNFGNKSSWDKSFNFYLKKFSEEINSNVFNNNKSCFALNKSIFDLDAYGYDLVYLDPPYLSDKRSNESSDYLKCYHFLEGLANYEEWRDLINFDTPNLRFDTVQYPQHFQPNNIKMQLEEIIYKFKNSIIVLSYKIGGIPSIEQLESMVKKHKKYVHTVSRHYKYALNRQNGNAAYNREVLIIGM